MTVLLYLGKVVLCSGILLGYYWLFLRNRRFHHYNRFYLQATLLLSITLPFVRIPVLHQPQNPVNQAVYATLQVLTVNYGETEVLTAGPGWLEKLLTLENGLYGLYTIGIAVLLWTVLQSLLYIRRISKRYPFERIGPLKFFTTSEPNTPFSFFSSIFWNRELPFNSHDGQQIFRHELFHVQQKHSTDIIITELVTAFFWCNPFFHILKKELKAIHEFLADQYAISNSDRYAYAELLVLQTIKANKIPITNHFFQNHIKRRITMITNNQRTRYSYRSRLMALPVLALLFCTIALYAQQSKREYRFDASDATKQPITVVIDAGHGGIDAGALSNDGKVKEKDLALQLCQKIQQLSAQYNVNVVMTRTNDDLPDKAATVADGLKARTAIAEKTKADLFISLHVSSVAGAPNLPRDSGIEIYVSNKNDNEQTKQSKQLGTVLAQELNKVYTTNQALLQRTTNIWVLERCPCPSLLIECGFITTDKDLAFFSEGKNQEAFAQKVLEGIVNYKSKIAATGSVITQPAATTAHVQQPPAKAPAIATVKLVNTPLAIETDIVKQTSVTQVNANGDELIIPMLIKYFCQRIRYPKNCIDNKIEGMVYFSLNVNEKGNVELVRVSDKRPSLGADKELSTIVTVGMYTAADEARAKQFTDEEVLSEFEKEIRRVFKKDPDFQTSLLPKGEYFFEIKFTLEKESTPVA